MKLNLTTLGKDMVLQCMEGGFTMVFCSIVIGNGDDAGSENSSVSNPLLEIPISNIERENDYVTLTGVFNNNGVADRFRAKEIGVYAEYEDYSGGTVKSLFAYGYVPDDEADIIPANTDYVLETTEQVQVFVGAIENLSAIINDSMVTVSKVEFDAHANNTKNPHRVTAEQIGLGNVPNAAPGDMTVEYETSEEVAPLTSGENFRSALGKIAAAVLSFISHLKASNPHNVTAAQVGAAKSTHYHNASQINAGTLSPARGGTGTTSLANLRTLLEMEGAAGIVTGSYTGKGTYGSSNKTSLTFASAPKLLVVMPVSNTSHADYGGFVVLNGVQALRAGGLSDDVSNSESQLQFTWGKTVSWYNTSNSYFQQNASGWTYTYFAIL